MQQLQSFAKVSQCDLASPEAAHALANSHIAWVRLRHQIDESFLKRAPALKIIASATTGLNHIDVEAAQRRGVTVVSLQGETQFLENIHATAEHTLALMLALLRHIPAAVSDVKNGHWRRDLFCGQELFGKRVGLIGFGRIGKQVAALLLAFGCQVSAYDVRPVSAGEVRMGSLDEVLHESDIVSLHMSSQANNHHFIDRHFFKKMAPHALFINTARGELVNEADLKEALEKRMIRGAALDVLESETRMNLESHLLLDYARRHSNLLLTPHSGGCTHESLHQAESFLARKLKDTVQMLFS